MVKILVVEDDAALAEIYSIRLRAEGYEVLTAHNGEEGSVMVAQEKPDLVVADIMMPKVTGLDMIENIRQIPEIASTKVIMMTALGTEPEKERATALGALRYLVKSQVGIEDLVNTVHDVLGDR